MSKKLLKLLLIIAALLAGYIYFQQPDLLNKQGAGIPVELNALQGNVGNQFSTLSGRAQELSGYAKNVLGSSIQVDESEESLQQRAINYGQYLYCKQVVETYETE